MQGLPTRTLRYDAWEAEEKLRHIGRMLRSGSARRKLQRHEPPRFRTDHSHGEPQGWHAPIAAKRRKAAPRAKADVGAGGAMLVWTSVSLGIMALACGGVLMAWSLLGTRPELWNVGLPIAILGQIALVLGLILQLDRLWRHHRRTAASPRILLTDLKSQLEELTVKLTQMNDAR